MDALAPVAEALGASLVDPDDVETGDVPLVWDGQVVGGFRQLGLHDVLDRLLVAAETEHGSPLAELDRETKQEVRTPPRCPGRLRHQAGRRGGRRPARGEPVHHLQLSQRNR